MQRRKRSAGHGEIQASLVRQLPSSVLWEDTVQTMGRMGVTTFVEIGPGTVLTGLIRRILPDAKLLNVNDPKSLGRDTQGGQLRPKLVRMENQMTNSLSAC